MIPKWSTCFSQDFLALRQFSNSVDVFPSKDDPSKLVKIPGHRHYNTPPFSHLDPRTLRATFHGTRSGYVTLDFDSVFPNKDGVPLPEFDALLRKYASLTMHEVSVSGKGAHFYIKMVEPLPFEMRGRILYFKTPRVVGSIEAYLETKWTALTGVPLFGKPHPEPLQLTVKTLQSLLDELATIRPLFAPGGVKPQSDGPLPAMDTNFDIQQFLIWLEIPVCRVEDRGDTNFYRLKFCPWSSDDSTSSHFRDHCTTAPAIALGGSLGFSCQHPSCQGRGIADLMRWARENGRGNCPTPLWHDISATWEVLQHKVAREFFDKNPFGTVRL